MMYKVISIEFKSGLFGTNIQKLDDQMSDILNKYEKQGWELVALTEMDTNRKQYSYKFVFKSKS
ncbi:MAG: DUF4177 domain-containing protein [Clostridia bacterium]|nr:DUF4177 domain-containing protein [Clostridia bacterium]